MAYLHTTVYKASLQRKYENSFFSTLAVLLHNYNIQLCMVTVKYRPFRVHFFIQMWTDNDDKLKAIRRGLALFTQDVEK